jgi:putative phosphoesterase
MKIAVLSDIHSNKYALARVLIRVKELDVKKILILGDFIGYYYDPDKILDMLSLWDCEFIQGNHERMFLKSLDDIGYSKILIKKYGTGFKEAEKKLNQNQIQFIRELPETRKIILDDIVILMCHGTVSDPDDYLYPDSKLDILNDNIIDGVDYVLTGHTHHRLQYFYNNTSVINFGSVGQSRETGGIAEWGIIDTENKVIRCMSTLYNQGELANLVERNDPNLLSLKDVLYRNN